jgi:hypothetical protein
MTKFIKVTEANGRESILLLNVAFIGSIQSGKDKDVYIKLAYNALDKDGKPRSDYYFVKETFAEIEKLIGG